MLQVRQQTLYSYVSRGLIRSFTQPGRKARLYLRDDIERMSARSRARSGHGAVAASAMNLGEPITSTAVTEITAAGPRYRGRFAHDLARMHAPFESVAELLWTGLWPEHPPKWPVQRPAPSLSRLMDSLVALQTGDQVIEIFALVTLHLGVRRGSVSERIHKGRTLDAAKEIIHALVGCCGLSSSMGRYVPMQGGQTVLQGLLRALAIEPTEENQEAISSMLVLLADHELSPGTFAARVAASSGATVHACIASALCASSGLEIGRLYTRVHDFLDGASSKGVLLARARKLQKRGLVVPGFVHPMYPQGDPRAAQLLEIAGRREEKPPTLTAALAFAEQMRSQFGLLPRHEFSAVLLCRALGLPRCVPESLFAVARVAGWVAHVQEQRLSGALLRPRGKFVGAGEAAFLSA